ncbi:MFS transporter [Devosia sp. A8/3-2]|nr:MFS transporter [Devosia sp. A8/3-2]
MQSGPHRTATPSTLITLAGATLLASLGISIATIALPTLALSFPSTLAELQWVILAYLLSMTVTIVSAGRFGDLHGHRRVLLAGLAVFTIASALCAASPNLGLLIAARALQGIGGAIITALPMSIARDVVREDSMGAAMGLLAAMSAVGTALGPSLGGIVMASPGWEAAFGLLGLGGMAILLLALRVLPASLPRTPRRQMDLPGALLLTLTLGLYALAATGAGLATPWGGAALLVPAAMALFAFIRVQLRSPHPRCRSRFCVTESSARVWA